MTITAAQVTELLDSYGVSVPSFVIDAAVEQAESVEACLIGAGHSAAQITMMQAYAAAIIAGGSDSRKIKSQGAPNGASRSFEYGTKGLSALRTQLSSMDTSGCTTDIIGPDPLATGWLSVHTGC